MNIVQSFERQLPRLGICFSTQSGKFTPHSRDTAWGCLALRFLVMDGLELWSHRYPHCRVGPSAMLRSAPARARVALRTTSALECRFGPWRRPLVRLHWLHWLHWSSFSCSVGRPDVIFNYSILHCTGASTGWVAHDQCPRMPFRTAVTPSGAIALVALVALVGFFLLCGWA